MRRSVTAALALVVLVGACGDAGATATTAAVDSATTAASPTTSGSRYGGRTTTTAPSSTDEVLSVASSEYGQIVVDGEGYTLYLFKNDSPGVSTCESGCADNWPPMTATAAAGDGIDGSLLATTTRPDGSVQVTYNGWPLYYFAGDAASGEVTGQGVNEVWYVVSPAGDPIE